MPSTGSIRWIPALLLLAGGSWLHPGLAAFAQAWITTNAIGAHDRHTNSLDYEMTPSLSTNVPNSKAYYNTSARIFLRLREKVIVMGTGSATYGGKVAASYDVRAAGSNAVSGMPREELRLIWQTNQLLLKASYYRGRLYYPGTDATSDEWMTVFSSADRKRIVTVEDSGPIHVSENAGVSWALISRPGEYEFKLSATPAGSKIVAVVSLTDVAPAATDRPEQKMANRNWYSVASAADGSQLVLTGGASESAPVLSITRDGNDLVLSWPAFLGAFALQQTADVSASQWESVTNAVSVIGEENQVRLPVSGGNHFFRLKKQ